MNTLPAVPVLSENDQRRSENRVEQEAALTQARESTRTEARVTSGTLAAAGLNPLARNGGEYRKSLGECQVVGTHNACVRGEACQFADLAGPLAGGSVMNALDVNAANTSWNCGSQMEHRVSANAPRPTDLRRNVAVPACIFRGAAVDWGTMLPIVNPRGDSGSRAASLSSSSTVNISEAARDRMPNRALVNIGGMKNNQLHSRFCAGIVNDNTDVSLTKRGIFFRSRDPAEDSEFGKLCIPRERFLFNFYTFTACPARVCGVRCPPLC